jgi:predicted nuclease of predicted toxin-antitoxin system
VPRILLDENLPRGLRRHLSGTAQHVLDMGWSGITNGRLLAAAEQAGFKVLITADRNLRFQQNLVGRPLALVVLSTNNWVRIRASLSLIEQALTHAPPGVVVELVLPP